MLVLYYHFPLDVFLAEIPTLRILSAQSRKRKKVRKLLGHRISDERIGLVLELLRLPEVSGLIMKTTGCLFPQELIGLSA